MRVCLGSFREGVESDPRRANVAGVGPSSLGSRETPRLPVRIHDLGEQSISTPVWFIYRATPAVPIAPRPSLVRLKVERKDLAWIPVPPRAGRYLIITLRFLLTLSVGFSCLFRQPECS